MEGESAAIICDEKAEHEASAMETQKDLSLSGFLWHFQKTPSPTLDQKILLWVSVEK